MLRPIFGYALLLSVMKADEGSSVTPQSARARFVSHWRQVSPLPAQRGPSRPAQQTYRAPVPLVPDAVHKPEGSPYYTSSTSTLSCKLTDTATRLRIGSRIACPSFQVVLCLTSQNPHHDNRGISASRGQHQEYPAIQDHKIQFRGMHRSHFGDCEQEPTFPLCKLFETGTRSACADWR